VPYRKKHYSKKPKFKFKCNHIASEQPLSNAALNLKPARCKQCHHDHLELKQLTGHMPKQQGRAWLEDAHDCGFLYLSKLQVLVSLGASDILQLMM
jgi:predicted Zn-ribbon and HTH transcriptional regulator